MRISDWSSDVCSSDLAEIVQGIDPDFGAQREKISIGRHHNGPMHIGGAVCGTARVAETLTAELEIARVGNTLSGRYLAQLQSGQPNERLQRGTDGIRTVRGSVDQGVIGGRVKLAPVLHLHA